ncbi:hypothetical protein K1719_034802 [Acacia pycnantha]|nr:hypothetical protein K1719_034802 [Acacia pycnantha]
MGLTAQVAVGLDHGIITMKMGEVTFCTFPTDSGNEFGNFGSIPSNSVVWFEVELISSIKVVDVCKMWDYQENYGEGKQE